MVFDERVADVAVDLTDCGWVEKTALMVSAISPTQHASLASSFASSSYFLLFARYYKPCGICTSHISHLVSYLKNAIFKPIGTMQAYLIL